MSWREVASFIVQNGFAVFVAVWLLLRTDNVMRELTKALQELTMEIKTRRGGN